MSKAYLSVDGKDGTNRAQAINVGGAIQWVKAHHIFALKPL